jgi:hypothetical protein
MTNDYDFILLKLGKKTNKNSKNADKVCKKSSFLAVCLFVHLFNSVILHKIAPFLRCQLASHFTLIRPICLATGVLLRPEAGNGTVGGRVLERTVATPFEDARLALGITTSRPITKVAGPRPRADSVGPASDRGRWAHACIRHTDIRSRAHPDGPTAAAR